MMDAHKVSVPRVLLKALILFVGLNLLFATFNFMPSLGRLSLYNWLLPGRQRLPYSDDQQRAYNLNLYSLEAMFASHELAGAPKVEDEYRVFVIGDSSVWGFLLENEDTLTAALNAAGLRAGDGRRAVFYNLGHPTIALTKDLMILDYAMDYDPDLILWPVTLEAFPINKQTSSPQVQNNAPRVRRLIAEFDLAIDLNQSDLVDPDFWGRTLVGMRRNLADMLRLQLYGFMWAATGIDAYFPETYGLRALDLEASQEFAGLLPPALPVEALAFDVLMAGARRAGQVPLLIINEPIFVSDGAYSDVRYNSMYPRWAYDAYRQLLQAQSDERAWDYVDLWQTADPAEFTNTPIHLTPRGTLQFADAIIATLQDLYNLQP